MNDPLAFNRTVVYGISGNNIVGYYLDSSGNYHGFLYNGSTYTTLNDPLGSLTVAIGVDGNNIVGYYEDSSGKYNGFLYNGSSYTTIDDPLGVEGTIANGISGNNIVGHYSDSSGTAHGFEAIPVPEPSTLALGILGATSAGLLALRRKQKRGQN